MMKGSMEEVQFHLHKKDFKETDHLKDHFHGKEFYRTGNVWPLARAVSFTNSAQNAQT
jgi:hypothetical protein